LELKLKAADGDDTNGRGATTLEGSVATSSPESSGKPGETSTATNANSEDENKKNEHIAFGRSVQNWPIFPDSSKALHDLSKYFHLIVLSNVDHASFAHTHAALSEGASAIPTIQLPSTIYSRPIPNDHPRNLWLPQLTDKSKSPFSLILTAQDTGAYKPDLRGFHAAFEAIRREPNLRAQPGAITDNNSAFTGRHEESELPSVDEVIRKTLSVAQSLTHDHVPVKQLGMRSVWIDRKDAAWRPTKSDGKEYGWTWRFRTLGDMAQAVEEELKHNA